MASQTSSAAETSGTIATAGSNLHIVIQVDPVPVEPSLHFVEMLLDRCWKNEEFRKRLKNYFDEAYSHEEAVRKFLNSLQSLIQDAEGSSSGVNWEAPLNFSHDQFFAYLNGVLRQQVRMRDDLQSFQNDLSQKLHRAQFWRKFSAVAFFTAAVVITAAATAIARKHPISEATALAFFLLSTFWAWTVSLLDEHMDGVRKHLEITDYMALGARVTIDGLRSLHSSASALACWFETQTKSISDADEERKKLVESFQELQGKAANLCRDICSARECTLESVKKHLDSMTRLS